MHACYFIVHKIFHGMLSEGILLRFNLTLSIMHVHTHMWLACHYTKTTVTASIYATSTVALLDNYVRINNNLNDYTL